MDGIFGSLRWFAACALAVLTNAGVGAETEAESWFVAGFGESASSIGGSWLTNVSAAVSSPVWEGSSMVLDNVAEPVCFQADEAVSSRNCVQIETVMQFVGFDELPSVESGAKTGVCAMNGDDGVTPANYHVLACDAETSSMRWLDTGIAADFEKPVTVVVTVQGDRASYSLGGLEFSEVPIGVADFSRVAYSGSGVVTALRGEFLPYGVELRLPSIAGLTVDCEFLRELPGAEVRLTFGADTAVPSVESAVYIVAEDGTLVLKPGQPTPVAMPAGARIGTHVYRTVASALDDAVSGDTITLCATQTLEVATIDRDVTLDLADCRLAVTNPVEIGGARLTVVATSGELVIAAEVTLGDSEAEIEMSQLDNWRCADGGRFAGESGTLRVGAKCISPNRMRYEGCFGGAYPALTIVVDGRRRYTLKSGPFRYATDDECAYATLSEGYVESFDDLQEAINAAAECSLTMSGEYAVAFNPDTVIRKCGFSIDDLTRVSVPAGYELRENASSYYLESVVADPYDGIKSGDKARFAAFVQASDAGGTVVLGFNAAGRTELTNEFAQAFSALDLAKLSAGGECSVTIPNPIPGVWYNLAYGSEPSGLDCHAEPKQATGGEISLALPRTSTGACFYRLKAALTPNDIRPDGE